MAIPDGITRKHLEKAIAYIDRGDPHRFAPSTKYDALWEGKRYPPKAVVGVAAMLLDGVERGPDDFSGGIGSKCFRVLQECGIQVIRKGDIDTFPDELDPEIEFVEGRAVRILVNRYERDPHAREACLNHFGVKCQICGIEFSEKYGVIGEGFIHVHHLKPISDSVEEYRVDPKEDLIPVCPNCHAMLHRRIPPFEPSELIEILANRGNEVHATNRG